MTDNEFGNMLMYIYCVSTHHIGGATTRSVLSAFDTPLIRKKVELLCWFILFQ